VDGGVPSVLEGSPGTSGAVAGTQAIGGTSSSSGADPR